MSRNLTASDRTSLIKLASSLPAGSPERKAILAGLTKISYDQSLVKYRVVPPKGALKAWLDHGDIGGVDRSHVGKKIWQGTVSASQVEEFTKGLQIMGEYADADFDQQLEDIEERIRELGYEKEEILLSPLFQKAHALSKKWGLPLSSDGQIYMNNDPEMHDSQGRYYNYSAIEGWIRDGNNDLK